MIFPPIELPQYIVVPPTDCEMKDIIGYHNKHLTRKISNCTGFFEKFEYLQLLCILHLDTIENREIYETYMHFGQIPCTARYLKPELRQIWG
jgi:hypothetical protein